MASLEGPTSDVCPEAETASDAGTTANAGSDTNVVQARRKGQRRSKTVFVGTSRRALKRVITESAALQDEMDLMEDIRPLTRADCVDGMRPCPFVSCAHHMFLDVSLATGSIKFNFPDKEVWELDESCVLDVADRGGVTLEEVAATMNLTRERARQLEMKGISNICSSAEICDLREREPTAAPTTKRGKILHREQKSS